MIVDFNFPSLYEHMATHGGPFPFLNTPKWHIKLAIYTAKWLFMNPNEFLAEFHKIMILDDYE